MKGLKKELIVCGGFLVFSVIMRFFSFFPSVISHDESTYMVIAREILEGKIYFVDLVDTKPVGIFLILAFVMKTFGYSVWILRLFTALIAGLTAFIIYRISLKAGGEERPAIASGVIYIFFLSVFTFFGVFINPEIFFLFFTALGLYVFISSQRRFRFFLTGLLLGIGFMIKYVVLFDLAAFLLFYFIRGIIKDRYKNIIPLTVNCAIACVAFILPFIATLLFYLKAGYINEFLYYTFEVTRRYPVESTFLQMLVFIGDFHFRFLPFIFLFYFSLFRSRSESLDKHLPREFMLLWIFMVLVIVVLPGKPFGHYFIQMMLPYSIYAGFFFSKYIVRPVWAEKFLSSVYIKIFFILIVAGQIIMQKHDYFDKKDQPREVANYLSGVMKEEDRLFTADYHQILYYLLEKDVPLKYVHRSLLCTEHHREALEIDMPLEVQEIMEQDIEFITVEDTFCYKPFNDYLDNEYEMIQFFEPDVKIYRHR